MTVTATQPSPAAVVDDGVPTRRATEGDGHPAVALGVIITSISLALVGLALTAIAEPDWGINQWFFAVDTVDAIVYGVVAWLVLSRVRHPVAWVLAVTAVGGGLAAVGAQWTLVWSEHPDLPELRMLTLMQSTGWVPGTLALIVVVPWLLRDRRLDVASRVIVGSGVALIGWTLLTRVTDPYVLPNGEQLSPLAIRSESWEQFVERSGAWQNGLLVALGLVATVDVVRRRATHTDPGARRALTWLAVAVFVLSIAFLPLALPDDLAAELPLAFTPLVHLVSQALYPAAILGVVLRHRLWNLDLAVRRTLTWWLLTSGLVVAYVVVVTFLGEVLPGDDGFAQVLTTAVVAAGFQPARAWIQRGVDDLVHGSAGQPIEVVREVGRTLGTAGPGELLTGVLAGLAGSLRLGGARIQLHDGAPGGAPATVGVVDDRAVDLPLVHQQVELGRLIACPRPNERLDGRSLASLQELTPMIAATVALASATDELRASRARLAEARDEERRTLRRELHDGLGPALAGIGLGLQAGRNLLATDPEAAAALFDRLSTELDASVEEVRGLARGLLPPVLEEMGLAPAIVDLAERHQASGLSVLVDVEHLPLVPPPVASAVYGIVAEAVRNVHRHAGATRCWIMAEAHDGLLLRVRDDGRGIPAGAVSGVGSRSMRERAEGVGGKVTIGTAPSGGTEVVVSIPSPALATVGGTDT